MAPSNSNPKPQKVGFFGRIFGTKKNTSTATPAPNASTKKPIATPAKASKAAPVPVVVPSKDVAAAAKPDVKAGRVLLPSYVVATKYNLTVTPNMSGDFKFKADVAINLRLEKAGLTEITLHSHELELTSCTFVGPDSKKLTADNFKHDAKLNTVSISFKGSVLPEGEGLLHIEFVGLHNNQMAGFYRSSYLDADGKTCTMVSTQFESLSARRCFPCVDEPAAKAVFETALIVDTSLTALSNMPESSSEYLPGGEKKKICFEATPLMSTYLLAFVVGDFDFCSTTSEHGVLIRVYTPPTKCHLGKFSLDAAKRCLDLYDDTFGVPFPLPKLDMVAIPEFAAGAMENWGLVTYREVELLIDELRASNMQKQRVCTVVTHELAHQWFGNLVTMAWWDDLWLNEGFAAWTQVYAADHLYPEWSMWEQFVIEEQSHALALDSLTTSHPIQVPIKHAEEVEEVFDAIAYMKGASVVRMLFAYLGKEHFVEGLQLYMNRHKYSNTETSDLWNAWQEVSGKPVAEIMKSWTEQMGFPVVTVKRSSFADGKCTMELEQEWFLADGSRPTNSDSMLWSIPLFISVGNADGKQVDVHSAGVMTERKMTVTVPAAKGAHWARLNAGQHIPMRVLYANAGDLAKLAEAVKSKQMNTTDRAGLILDAYALTRAGKLDAGELINLLSAYKAEDTMPVWSALEQALGGVGAVLKDDPELSAHFKSFAKTIVTEAAARVGWNPSSSDGHLGGLLRATLVRLQAKFMADEPHVLNEACERFDKYLLDPNAENVVEFLPADIKVSVFSLVQKDPKQGPAARLQQLKDVLAKAETVAERKDVYSAIGATPNVADKRAVLDWCTSGEVLLQDFFYPINSVNSSSKEGRDLTWEYCKENFQRMYDMVKSASPSLISAVASFSSNGFNTKEAADDIEAFFKEQKVDSITRRVAQIVERTRGNAVFRQRIHDSAGFQAAMRDSRSVNL